MPTSRRNILHLPLLSALLLCLLTSQVSAFGYVWCIGVDGHAAMETALAGDCGLDSPERSASPPTAPTLSAGDDDCGPCHDVSTTPQWGAGRHRAAGSPPVFATFTHLPAAPPSPRLVSSLTGLLDPDPPPRISRSILQHRTVVLLI